MGSKAVTKSTSVEDRDFSFRRIFTCLGCNGAGLALNLALGILFELVMSLFVRDFSRSVGAEQLCILLQ